MAEKAPLYGNKDGVMPPRLSSGDTIQRVELAVFVIVALLAIASIVVAVVFTISSHAVHFVGAITAALGLVLLTLIARLYRKDELQDRKIVYLAVMVSIFASITPIVYVASWDCSAATTTPSCPSTNCPASAYYSPAKDVCLTDISGRMTNLQYPCYFLQSNSPKSYTLNAMLPGTPYFAPNNTLLLGNIMNIFKTCFQNGTRGASMENLCRCPR